MTGRATFGDFLQAAHRHLDPPPGTIGQPPARGDAGEVSQSLMRVLTVMGRHLHDLTAAFDALPTGTQPARSTWARACIEAREAIATSALFLAGYRPATRWPAVPAASPLARRLDTVTISLTTGRDLLHTHFAPGAGSSREHRSEWAAAVTSPAVTRALLGEVWGHAYEDDTHTLRVHIANLRRKIEPDSGDPRYIRTDPGVGYRFVS